MKYKAIISDIDGTLTPLTEYSQLSDTIKNAIKTVQEKNISFSLATGKPFYLIEHLIDQLHLTSPVIIDNGAAIYDSTTKQPIWESIMNRTELLEVFSLAKKYNKRIRISSGKDSVDVSDVTSDHQNVTKLLVMGLPVKEAEEYIKQVEENYKNLAIVRAQAHEGEKFSDIYITNADATKQHAVLKLAEILGIKTEEMIGIGDHYNDFPLLMACGFKVAMGNAVDDLKAIADYIAPSVEEDGVADVIEKFILNA